METDKTNERILRVLKNCEISPDQALALEAARRSGKDLSVTLIIAPGEFSEKPTEDGKFNSIYRVGIIRLDNLTVI